MAKMTERQWEKLHRGFDTYRILDAVDQLDSLRYALSDDGIRPPEIRDKLLKLHGLAMSVVNNGQLSQAREMFDLAFEIDEELIDIEQNVELMRKTTSKLVRLCPDIDWDAEDGPSQEATDEGEDADDDDDELDEQSLDDELSNELPW